MSNTLNDNKNKKIEQLKKVDYLFLNIFNSLNSVFNSMKINNTNTIEDNNSLEISTSLNLIANSIEELIALNFNLKLEALKRKDVDEKQLIETKCKSDVFKKELELKLLNKQDQVNQLNILLNDIRNNKFYKYGLNVNMFKNLIKSINNNSMNVNLKDC